MKSKAFYFLFIGLIVTSLSTIAQNNKPQSQVSGITGKFNISGKVFNSSDKKPIVGASIFLSNSTIGGTTDNAGTFSLANVNAGKYTLVVSVVGFDIYTQEIILGNSSLNLQAIYLNPQTITLAEVKIKSDAKKDSYADWYYATFKREFLGTSDLAQDCRILNPEVLDFSYDDITSTLTASSYDFLEIENDDLGYKIKYLLTNFKLVNKGPTAKEIHYEGSVFFTAMKGTPRQEHRWAQNRQDVYEGSSMHFFRSVLNDQLDEAGFEAFRLAIYLNPLRPADSLIAARVKKFNIAYHDFKDKANFDSLVYWRNKLRLPKIIQELQPLHKQDVVSASDRPGIFRFGDNKDAVLVVYNSGRHFPDIKQLNDFANLNFILNKPNNKEFTLLNFEEPYTLFDNNGGTLNPNSLVFTGAWVGNRLAELLPLNYEPPAARNAPDTLSASDTVFKNTIAKVNANTIARPVEKVYLHLDRSYYNPGDTLWFKAYTVIGPTHQLSALSGILYCELINAKDSVISRHVMKLTSGLAWGDFTLPATAKPGKYHVRAYTNWMRNEDAAYFYNQEIYIGGLTGPAAPLQLKTTQLKPDLQFFPEGGDLVNGVRAKIAVKSINANGLGGDIKGIITDNEGNEITTFATTHLGMGVFALTPLEGKSYKAIITCADSTKYTFALPDAHLNGFTLAVNGNTGDSVYVKIEVNSKLFKEEANAGFYLLAQSGGKVYYTAKGRLEHPVFTAEIPKNRFPTGITQFTLFSQNGEPIAERVVFMQSDDTIKMALSSSSKTYAIKEKVKINLDTKAENELPVAGTFSVSVINMSRLPLNENAESTILNNLLLTSDLKGYIEQPNYYFNHINDQTRADLDMLMLTQGYRRLEWKKILNNTDEPVTYQPETLLEIAGSIKTQGKKPVPNGKIILAATRAALLVDTVADSLGNFRFTNINLTDTDKVILRASKQNNGSNVLIYLKQPDYPEIAKNNINTDTIATQATPQLVNSRIDYKVRLKQDSLGKGRVLKEVVVKDNAVKKPDLSNSANLMGPGHADQVIMGDEIFNCVRLSDCLIGKINGMIFENGVPYRFSSLSRLNKVKEKSDIPPVAVIIDGRVTASKSGEKDELDPNDIYSIEVLKPGASSAIYGTEAYEGALIITTRRGNEPRSANNISPSGLLSYTFNGFHVSRTFYSPQYNNPKTDMQPDARSTIYWNPNIVTGKDGSATFEYYNAATKGNYRVVVEGINANGNIGRAVYKYTVQ